MNKGQSRVPCPLRSAALASPEAPAILDARGAVSYADLDALVSAAEVRLAAFGLSTGDRVALYLPKGAGYLTLLLALMRSGIVACPVSTRLPAGSVVPLLEKVSCSALISDDKDLIDAAGSTLRNLQPETLLEEGATSPDRIGETCEIQLDGPATIVFTSGSTGTPKAALHTYRNHYFNALGSNENLALASGDRWLHSLPLYHVGGLSILFRCLISGAAMALPEADAPVGESISRLGATHVSLVSTQLLRLLGEDDDPQGLKAILMGGGRIPEELVEEALARGLPIHTSYGLTEMASQVTTTPAGAFREELRTSGRALPYREVRVSGEGEILVRGRTLFAGYARGTDLDPSRDDEGWFRTGDLGELDDEGYLRVTGRRDNLFVSGGENVQPEEVESALLRLEGVQEARIRSSGRGPSLSCGWPAARTHLPRTCRGASEILCHASRYRTPSIPGPPGTAPV